MERDKQCTPLRAQPWLGETHFRLVLSESEGDGPSSIAGPMFDELSTPEPETSSKARGILPGSNSEVGGLTSSSSVGVASENPQKTVSAYGPIRHRSFGSGRGAELVRPPELRQEDLCEVLEEFSQHGNKRSHSPASGESPEHKVARTSIEEALLVEALMTEKHELVESLVTSFLQKKLQHELRHSNNPPALQEKIDDAKIVEFIHTLQNEKHAIRIVPPYQVHKIRRSHPDRIMSSRFVITEKKEDNSSRIKARWCLRGHHDPDLVEKVLSGKCHSPTLS